ncbi:uncharacterized protein METZ01_LOCUS145163 [marine metagenome]|uniref:Uncharacterized protein n=1 Tax=marine metagenome TaxID=408172 RepID=A0A381ZSY3_9ZZZZ
MYHSGSTRMYLEALVIRYEADIANARANLQTYFRNGVGVAEHPDIMDSLDKVMEQLVNAQEKFNVAKDLMHELTE